MPRIALYVLGAVVVIPLVVVAIGYALPQGHVASVNTTLPVPPHQVFERISNPAHYREWRKDITAIEIIAAQPPKWRERSSRDVITFEVVDSRPPERFVVRIADARRREACRAQRNGPFPRRCLTASQQSTHLAVVCQRAHPQPDASNRCSSTFLPGHSIRHPCPK